MDPIQPIPLSAIEAARERISGAAIRTPLLRLDRPESASEQQNRASGQGASDAAPGGIWLKLECLQPIGSFKIRGAANAMALADPAALAKGVYTASAGNKAQGVAFAARRLGIPCRVIVPDSAPQAKLSAVARLGGVAVPVPFDEWWASIRDHGHPDESGFFIHPVSDPAVIAGNGTAGLEIVEDLPDVDTVVIPYGGGGLSAGIASAIKSIKPDTRVYASEVETAAPFQASLTAGRAVSVDRVPTFVDGIGGSSVLEEMWPLTSSLLDGSHVVSIVEICDSIRMLASQAHVIAEGAGASSVAAACRSSSPDQRIVAVVSGGNIDTDVLSRILAGANPLL
jgi:threonine dehydratase